MEEREASESDDDVMYSLADNPGVGRDTEEQKRAVSDSFISKSSLERWSSNAPTVSGSCSKCRESKT